MDETAPRKCKYCAEDDANSTDPCTCGDTDCGADLCESPTARKSWLAGG